MRPVIAAALALLLLLFLMPMLLLGDRPLLSPEDETGGLPIDRPVVTPSSQLDRQVQLKLYQGGQISTVTMDQYLWSVVAAEMPASFELEALKAQAVAARTYAWDKLSRETAKHPDADLCTDSTCCQAYIDHDAASANWGSGAQLYQEKIAQAVAATDGQVILYEGAPIQAVFFSSAPGKTADAVEVWGNSIPYLTSVDSPEGEEVPNYHSTVTFPLEEFRSIFLAQYPQSDLSGDPSGWFQNLSHTSNGGVAAVEVGGVSISGTALRALFQLRSTYFTPSAGAEGVTFQVTGYGHGVGMSQYGANSLAKEGKTYQEILQWYYTGVTISPYPQ